MRFIEFDMKFRSLIFKNIFSILNLLREIHKKDNVTLVLVTHEDYVAESADRVINMMDGKIIA
jgi:ABC-type lipoprotein export system ATPase subunit